MGRHLLIGVLLLLSFAAAGVAADSGPVRVAVASNFLATLEPLAEAFEAHSGTRVVVSSGSTGKLYAQIRQGAPFDVFLAADARRPRLLEREGPALQGSRFTYARGRLVLWSRDPELLADGPAPLADGRIARLAVANPRTAPYGSAAVETLEHLGLWQRWAPRVVRGENVGQTLHFAATGNVDAAFVALAQVRHPAHRGRGSLWEVPETHYRPIDQQAVQLRPGTAAAAFLAFLRSRQARGIIEDSGYHVPSEPD